MKKSRFTETEMRFRGSIGNPILSYRNSSLRSLRRSEEMAREHVESRSPARSRNVDGG